MSGLKRIGDKVEIPFIGVPSDPMSNKFRRMSRYDSTMSDKRLVNRVLEDTLQYHSYVGGYGGRSAYVVMISKTTGSTYPVSNVYFAQMVPHMVNGVITGRFVYTKSGGVAYSLKLEHSRESNWKALVTEYGMIRSDYSQEGLMARGYSGVGKNYGKNDSISLSLELKRIMPTSDRSFYVEFVDTTKATPDYRSNPVFFMFGSDFNTLIRNNRLPQRGNLEGKFMFRKVGTYYGVVYIG